MNLQNLTEAEKLILIKAIATGAVSHLTPESIFTFSKSEADKNPELIPLGAAQPIEFEIVIEDKLDGGKPLKSLKDGTNYNFDDLELLQHKNKTQFVCADAEDLAYRLFLITKISNR